MKIYVCFWDNGYPHPSDWDNYVCAFASEEEAKSFCAKNDCPGRYFGFEEMTLGAVSEQSLELGVSI